ncbi:MAG: hypothetical protein U0V56_02555 [Actinomycetota bacterium]
MDARRLRAPLFGYAVVPLDGTAGYELSLGGQATYSPDGTRVAVVTGNSIAVLDAEGSPVSEVHGRLGGVEAWSPDGEHFASLSRGELNVVDVATGSVTLVTEVERSTYLSVIGFSPQGDRILFSRTEDRGRGEGSLWSVGVDGSDPRLVIAGTTAGDWLAR